MEQWNAEAAFLRPAKTSLRESRRIAIAPNRLSARLFIVASPVV